jgi:O-antigen ligase
MVATYFPTGSGLGSFSNVFQVHEPLDMLTTTYLNHAHNEFLEIASDAGIAGVALLAAALLWWLRATLQLRKTDPDQPNTLAKAGSAIIFLSLVASLVDYPARTPILMAVLVIAGTWLFRTGNQRGPALPLTSRHL